LYKHDPLVSVIVPCFNAQRFIVETLDSIFHQTYTNIEVIVIDDGSIDATIELISRYKCTSKAKLHLYMQGHCGPSAARNKGIWSAEGDFIAFLDADDYWMPRKLEMQLPLMTQSKDCVFSHSPEQVVDEKGQQVGLSQRKLAVPDSYLESLLVVNCVSTSTVVARTTAVKSVGGFDSSFRTCEDWDLWIRLAQLGSIAYLDEPMTAYRLHSANTHADIDQMRKDINHFYTKHSAIIPDVGTSHKLTKIGRNLSHSNLSYGYWERGKNIQAAYEACRAIVMRPLNLVGYKRLIRALITRRRNTP